MRRTVGVGAGEDLHILVSIAARVGRRRRRDTVPPPHAQSMRRRDTRLTQCICTLLCCVRVGQLRRVLFGLAGAAECSLARPPWTGRALWLWRYLKWRLCGGWGLCGTAASGEGALGSTRLHCLASSVTIGQWGW